LNWKKALDKNAYQDAFSLNSLSFSLFDSSCQFSNWQLLEKLFLEVTDTLAITDIG